MVRERQAVPMIRKTAVLAIAIAALATGCMTPGVYVSGGVGVAGGRGYVGGGIGGYYPYGYGPYGYGSYGYSRYRYPYGERRYGSRGPGRVVPHGRADGRGAHRPPPDGRWVREYGSYHGTDTYGHRSGYPGFQRRYPPGDGHRNPRTGPGVRPMPGTDATDPMPPPPMSAPPAGRSASTAERRPVRRKPEPYEAIDP